MVEQRRPVRIANFSGFYGDRLSAVREVMGPEPVDVLTGDYLAELTMLILWKARQKDPTKGYATTFLRQLEDVLGECVDEGIKIVANAGGLNPAGLAAEVHTLAARLGIAASVAYVDGDDLSGRLPELQGEGHALRHMDSGIPLAEAPGPVVTANAYLGGWGVTRALAAGADVVVCPRVADAALAVGPAAWWHGWQPDDWDALAGAVAAGHVIECGPQATGGNYPFLDELRGPVLPGFPIAEVAYDGSSVITKQPGSGGAVTVGTVLSQLLYEIAAPSYATPDVVSRFDTLSVAQDGTDRVRINGARGEPAPAALKVAITVAGGFRNAMTLGVTGLDIERKAAHAEAQLWHVLGGREQFADVDVTLVRTDRPDASTEAEATAQLRISVKDPDPVKVGRQFSNAVIELALAGYAGVHVTTPPTAESAFGVYWPALVPADVVTHAVVLPDGSRVEVPHPAALTPPVPVAAPAGVAPYDLSGPTERLPLGAVCGARSGDKGGNANVGLWALSADGYAWLCTYLTAARFAELVPEAAHLPIHRYELPNLRALNFVVVGLLGDGVAASTRPDPQAKGLAEFVRSRLADVPVALVAGGGVRDSTRGTHYRS